ncbi:selenoprotein V-like [Schistocerca nitens]|uniref:selenoprotein V-like n=1 Tax=Schistocerca nitens TaxID=7011 RepID=UPI002118E156|nr:selenoprotein V-like [Schistocerca nitens]
MPPAQLHTGAPRVVAPAPAVPLQSPPPSELMDVDPSAGPPSQAVAVQPVLQPLSLGTPKESDTAAPCPAPTQQPSTQRQETLSLFVGPDAPSRPVPEAAPVVTGEVSQALNLTPEVSSTVSCNGGMLPPLRLEPGCVDALFNAHMLRPAAGVAFVSAPVKLSRCRLLVPGPEPLPQWLAAPTALPASAWLCWLAALVLSAATGQSLLQLA